MRTLVSFSFLCNGYGPEKQTTGCVRYFCLLLVSFSIWWAYIFDFLQRSMGFYVAMSTPITTNSKAYSQELLEEAMKVHRGIRVVSAHSSSHLRAFSTSGVFCSDSGTSEELTPGEKKLVDKIHIAFPDATYVQVSDVSGGCGAMYQISIESPQFKGKRTIQQHRMVNEALAEDIKNMHGLQLNTKAPGTDK